MYHRFSTPVLYTLVLLLFPAPALRAQQTAAPAKETQERRAFLTVRVYSTATLTVDGNPTKQTGEVRKFYSPPLEPGKKYSYTFVASWRPGNNYETYTVTRKVRVEAGLTRELDLSKFDPKRGDTLQIIYVPTPQEIVDAMMKLGGVGKDDVVYDLGCGDGRIVITAVKDRKSKRGVGVDYDEKKITLSKENAQRAGVADKLKFYQNDVLKFVRETDISDATVVMLYLSDDLNVQLREGLLKQLKPGTRIVSHRFLMGDWKPEKTEKIETLHDELEEDKLIHLWTIKKK